MLTMLTLLTQLPRSKRGGPGNRLYGPPWSNAGHRGCDARDLGSAPSCVSVVLEGRNQQRRVAGGQSHIAPPIASNAARDKCGSVHVARPDQPSEA
jgi:hypothetical protein